MTRLALYDLDKTLLRQATFTPFLHFAALKLSPWRLLLSPVWIILMIGYRAGLYDRTRLKRMGMGLMLGNPPVDRLEQVGRAFAKRRIANDGLMPGAMTLIDEDRNRGARLVIATAAFEFYARAFADALEIDDLVATRWDGKEIPGGNCYGEEKKRRVLAWCEQAGIDFADANVRFVSDSFADAPLLDIVDDPVFVTTDADKAKNALDRGWRALDLTRTAPVSPLDLQD